MTVPACFPDNETDRIQELRHYQILDTLPEPQFDDLTQLASQICGTPIALISLVDSERQWFKSRVGLDATETHRDLAFCAHAILDDEMFVVQDAAADRRFANNDLVTADPKIRFYAGAPLVSPRGFALGTLCVIDRVPRTLDPEQLRSVEILGRQVIAQMELRSKLEEMASLVTDVEYARDELTRSNLELESFASIVSHDLQEPLRKILVFGDRLQSRTAEGLDEKNTDYLKRMQSAASRMRDLIQGVLRYSRVTTKAEELEEVDLRSVVDGVLTDLEVQIEECGARIEVGPLPTLWGAPLQLGQLFQNLIGNALKFRKAGEIPIVEIASTPVDATVPSHRLVVQDNGIGFEPDYAERIFGVFQRLHGRDEYPGTGIGLSVCRRIVDRHEGQIEASGTPGEGARFSFTLPQSPSRARSHPRRVPEMIGS